MPAHVYECEPASVEALKKRLSYDPYLDPAVIPPSKNSDKKESELTEDERKERAEHERIVQENLAKLKADPFGSLIFARQEYDIIDSATLGLGSGKSYLYLKANEQFLELADRFFAEGFKGVKRAQKEEEASVLGKIAEREQSANAGFGAIFG